MLLLLLLLALEVTVHYSCWDNFTITDWTRYSSEQDTNTSLKGKQMQTSTQLWGSRDISLSMLDLRRIQSLETKAKPRVVTHAHQMAAKCQHHTIQVGLCVQESHFILPYCYYTRGHCAFDTLSLLAQSLEFIFLFKKGSLPSPPYSDFLLF